MINCTILTSAIKNIRSTIYVVVEKIDNITMGPENDLGHIEYKRCMLELTSSKMEKYATQMQWRIGQNKKNYATYFIGIDDNGSVSQLKFDELVESVDYFIKICDKINASISSLVLIQDSIGTIIKINVKVKSKVDNNMCISYMQLDD